MLERLRHLPRETRDTLFLLCVIAWIIAPQAANLPAWCTAMAALVLLWRGAIAVRGRGLPSRWWVSALLVLACVATLLSQKTVFGRDAGVTLIVVLLSLKTLEMRARRDAFVIFFLGFFTMLSNFFYSQSLLTAASMVIALLGLLSALVNAHMPVGRPPLFQSTKIAAGMALMGAPIMVILFVLFPRVAPLWGLPSDAMSGRSGLSANMQVGNIASLALDGSVAMRIHFDNTVPPQGEMYFRGPVLASFDGRQWRPPSLGAVGSPAASPTELQTLGEPVRYEVTLEPTQRPWIMVLDATPLAPELKGYAPRIGADLQWVADRPLTELVRYRAQSYTHFRYGPQRAGPALLEYLDLPPGYNPRTREFAARMRKDPLYAKADSATLVAAVLERLRSGGYTYTLSPGLFGNDSADEFWFDRKQGFCEHIASAFVILMRALGVPARIVTGYQGGQANAVDGYWTVRQSDAHAWAEIWVASQGWVRVDPTAAIAPGRTGGTQRLEAPSGIFNRALITINPRFAFDLRNLWEAANNRWNQWILNYSQERQFDLLRNLGFASPDWEDVGYVLIGIVVLASLLGALWTLWEKHQHDPWLRLLHDAQRRLARAGLLLAGNSSARQTALKLRERAAAADPAIDEIGRWLLRLETWRYAKNSPLTLGTLREEFRRLHWPRQLP